MKVTKEKIDNFQEKIMIFTSKALFKKEKAQGIFLFEELDLLVNINFDMAPDKVYYCELKKYSTDEVIQASKPYFNFYTIWNEVILNKIQELNT